MPRALVRDTAKVSLLTVLAKLAGALKTVVIARYFGAAGILDAYLLAFLPISFVIDSISGSMMNALLPAFVETGEREGCKSALALYRNVQMRMLGLLLAVALAIALLASPLLHLLATGFGDDKILLTRNLLFIMLPILPLSALNVCWRAFLNAQEKFTVAAASPTLVPIFTVAALIVMAKQYGVSTLAIGTVTGAVAESLLLFWRVRAAGAPLFGESRVARGRARAVFVQYVSSAGSSLVLNSSSMVDQSMAAMLGAGSVAILNYGTRLVTVVLAVGPAALSTVILPWFSRLTARGDEQQVRRNAFRYSLLILAAAVPLTIILVALSKPLVEIMFQRGAFTGTDTDLVARVQSYSLLRIPWSVLVALLWPMVASMKRNSLLLMVAVFSVIANVLLNLIFMRTLGIAGLVLSTAVVHLFSVLLLASQVLKTPARGDRELTSPRPRVADNEGTRT
jgi:putative peptidoglycan lipid II flippase